MVWWLSCWEKTAAVTLETEGARFAVRKTTFFWGKKSSRKGREGQEKHRNHPKRKTLLNSILGRKVTSKSKRASLGKAKDKP